MKGPVHSETGVDKAAPEHLISADHTMRLLALQFFNHLHGFLENNTLHALESEKLFE